MEDSESPNGHSNEYSTKAGDADIRDQHTTKSDKSLKEILYDIAKRTLSGLQPVTRPITIGSILIAPFTAKVKASGWERYLPFINSTSDKVKISNFGKHVPLDEMYSIAAKMAKAITDEELAEFERAELLQEGEIRGNFDGYMYHGRLLGYDPQYYATAPLPVWAWPEIPQFRALSSLGDVEINEPHANTGFWDLKPLFPRDNGTSLYKKYIQEGTLFMERVSSVEHPSRDLLRSLLPPVAIFWRAQSDGRPVWAASKTLVIPEALIAQPLQRALEPLAWYAYGTREQRFKQMSAVLNGPPGIGIVDGDDLSGKLADGRIFNGDASSFDSSVREKDLMTYTALVLKSADASERTKRTYNACLRASLVLDGACGVGMITRTIPHGLLSGIMDTHSAGSVIEYARWRSAKPWSTPSTIVDKIKGVGGLMSLKKQHITKRSVELAKLFCNGSTLYGSIVRGIYGLVMYEDNPSAYMGPDDDDARVISIVANTWSPFGEHPLWHKFVSWVKSHWEIRGEKARVLQLAKAKLDKRRLFQRSGESNTKVGWEQQAMKAAWDVLL